MSQLGKIFLWIALVGAVVAVIAGIGVLQQRSGEAAVLNQSKLEADNATRKATKAQAEADASAKAKADDDTQLAEQKSKLDDLSAKLGAAEKAQTDLQTAVQQSKDALTKAQSDLDHVGTVLKGSSPEDVMTKVDKLTAQVQADASEQKILQDQLQAAAQQVENLKTEINASKTGLIPPGVSGKVTFVNRTWNFVVLNIGLSNGVVPNGELIVYRGRNFLGKIKITSAEDNSAVADILPDAKADIQAGDDVLN